MENIDLNTYKKQMIRDITGYNPDGSDNILVIGSGLDVINQIGDILGKDYTSIDKLCEDIEKLKSEILYYNLFD